MAIFRFFKMAVAASLDFLDFNFLTVGTVNRVELHQRTKFCKNRSNRGWDITIYRFFQDGVRRHLGFLKFQIFNVRSGQECRTASACQISSKSLQPWMRYNNFFDFSKMAAVRHLGFVIRVWDHPRRAFGGLYHCSKFGWNRYSSFDSMHVFRFRKFGLKTSIHAQKLGVFDPVNGEQCEIFLW